MVVEEYPNPPKYRAKRYSRRDDIWNALKQASEQDLNRMKQESEPQEDDIWNSLKQASERDWNRMKQGSKPKYRAKLYMVVPSANVEPPSGSVVLTLTNQPIVSAQRYARRIKRESKLE